MMNVFGAGVALAFLLCVPPWPYLNRHPLKWLKKPEGVVAAGGGGGARGGAARGGAGKGKGKKRCAAAPAGRQAPRVTPR
jgi:hypothetical protein